MDRSGVYRIVFTINVLTLLCEIVSGQHSWETSLSSSDIFNAAKNAALMVQPPHATCGDPTGQSFSFINASNSANQSCFFGCDPSRTYPKVYESYTLLEPEEFGDEWIMWQPNCEMSTSISLSRSLEDSPSFDSLCFLILEVGTQLNRIGIRETHMFNLFYDDARVKSGYVFTIEGPRTHTMILNGTDVKLQRQIYDYDLYENLLEPNRDFHITIQVDDFNAYILVNGHHIPPTERFTLSKKKRRKRQSQEGFVNFISFGAPGSLELQERLRNGELEPLRMPQCQNLRYSALVSPRFRESRLPSANLVNTQENIVRNIFNRRSSSSIYNCPYDDEEALTLFACAFYARPYSTQGNYRLCRDVCEEIKSACGDAWRNLPILANTTCVNDEYFVPGDFDSCIGAPFYAPEVGIFEGKIQNYRYFDGFLTEREIQSFINAEDLPLAHPHTECLCPPDYPIISPESNNFCLSYDEVYRQSQGLENDRNFNDQQLRYNGDDLYIPEMVLDEPGHFTAWVSAEDIEQVSLDFIFPKSVQVLGVTFFLSSQIPRVNHTRYPGQVELEIQFFNTGSWRTVHHLNSSCRYAGSGLSDDEYYASEVPCHSFDVDYSAYTPARLIQAYTVDLLLGKLPFYNETYMDVELLHFLHSGGVRIKFNGFPAGDVNAQHVVYNVEIFARDYGGRVLCDCYTIGTRLDGGDEECDERGQCPCRTDIGNPRRGGLRCEPYISDIYPTYGPASGGTRILIYGGYFGDFDRALEDVDGVIHVAFGNSGIKCQNVTANATLITCKTPALNNSNVANAFGLYLDEPLIITVQLQNFQLNSDEYFTFKPDPYISDIQPLDSFVRGGIIQTVAGNDFESVAVPIMTVTVWDDGRIHGPYRSPCTVISNTIMHCPSPTIPWDESNDRPARRRRDTALIDLTDAESYETEHLNEENGVEPIAKDRIKRQTSRYKNREAYLQFYVGFILDGVPTYVNVSESHLGTEIGIIDIFDNPDFEEWDPEILIFKPFEGDKFIEIDGAGLNFGAQQSDYKVTISDSTCTVAELNTNKLICQPPNKRPKHDGFSKKDANRVVLLVGTISFQVGYLNYYHSLWDDPAVRTAVIATVVVVGVIILGLIITYLVLRCLYKEPITYLRARLKYRKTNQDSNSYEERPRRLMDMLPPDLKQKIAESLIEPHSRMRLGNEIGKGNFGKVYAGLLAMPNRPQPMDCAIKTLKEDSSNEKELREFLEEATIMKDFQHPNVLTLYGVVILQNKPHVLLPFMAHGDLRGYVNNPRNNFSVGELLDYGLQVAKGMEYLASMKFVHRDLAARNCMVDDKRAIKIADFGLARDIHERDYYAVEDRRRPMPIKWMAPECLDNFKFDSRSDVWSYGVTLWEIMMRGRKPYPGIDTLDMKRYLLAGNRLSKPAFCPDPIYDLQLNCWHANASERPLFGDIVMRLSQILDEARQIETNNQQEQSFQNVTDAHQHDYLEMVTMRQSSPGYVPLQTDVPSEEENRPEATGESTNGITTKVPSERYTREPQAPSPKESHYLKPFTELPHDQQVKDEVEGYAGVRRPSQDKDRYSALSVGYDPKGGDLPREHAPAVPKTNPDVAYLAPTGNDNTQVPSPTDGYLPPVFVERTSVDVDNTTQYSNL